ncbi:MAG: DUF3108 domain-containing protein [Magnetospirillum sp.]|nr:DUF3108 domain-containing protein [Magnetospirillum sp.]
MATGIRMGLILAVTGAALLSEGTAADAAQMRYSVYWGGFHTADVALSDVGASGGYHASLDVSTTGLAERLSGLSLQVDAWGKAVPRDTLSPDRFSADTTRKDEENKLAVQFDHGTAPARIVLDETRSLAPADEDEDPPAPPVPPEQRIGTLDPLSAIMEVGRRARDALKDGPRGFTLPVYDGRHRYDARVAVQGMRSTDIDDRQVQGVAVLVTFVPVAGFRDKARDMWNNARFSALIDPSTGLPLRIVSEDFAVATVITAQLPPSAEAPARN